MFFCELDEVKFGDLLLQNYLNYKSNGFLIYFGVVDRVYTPEKGLEYYFLKVTISELGS